MDIDDLERLVKLMKENDYRSIMQVPKLTKITINVGVGEATQNPKTLEAAVNELTQISSQKPQVNKARKSILGKIDKALA